MKRFVLFLFCTLIIVPSIVSAHTSLSSSNPSEGQVVTEDLKQITLNYATTIEELSTMKLVKEGSEIPLKEIKVENKDLIGTISQPLENGSYTIQWNIIGEDGHPIKGEIPFTVQMEQEEPGANTAPPEQENVKKEDQGQSEQMEQKNTNEATEKTDVQSQNSSSTKLLTTIFIGLLIIFGAGLLWFLLKKR